MNNQNIYNSSSYFGEEIDVVNANIQNLTLEDVKTINLEVDGFVYLPSLNSNRIVQTDGEKKLTTSNTLNNITLTGVTNLSTLTANQLLKLDSSKNIVNDTSDYIDSSELTSALSLYVTITSLITTLLDYVTNSSLISTLSNYVTSSSLISTLSNYVTNSSLTSTLSNYVTSSSLTSTLSNYVTSSNLTSILTNYLTWTGLSTPTNNTYDIGGSSNRIRNIHSTYNEIGGSNGTKFLIKNNSNVDKFIVYTDSDLISCQMGFLLNGSFQQDGASSFSTSSGPFNFNSSTINMLYGTASRIMQTDVSKNIVYSNTLTNVTLSGNTTTGLTASRALITNASSQINVSSVTSTELGYMSGVTSAIQTQLNTLTTNVNLKANSANPSFTGTITTPLTASRLIQTNASSQLTASNTLPSSCSATNMSLTTPTISNPTITNLATIITPSTNKTLNFGSLTNGFNNGFFNSMCTNSLQILDDISNNITLKANLVLDADNTYNLASVSNCFALGHFEELKTNKLSTNDLAGNTISLKSNIIPETNNSFDLGSSSFYLNQIYTYQVFFGGSLYAITPGITAPNAGTNGLAFYVNGGDRMYITGGGNFQITGSSAFKASGTAWVNPSDGRLKEEIEDFTIGLDTIDNIRPRKFKYKNGTDNDNVSYDKKHVGIIAQEILDVYPKCIKQDDNGYYSYDSNDLLYILINSVKDLKKWNNALQQRIITLENNLMI